MAFIHSIFSMIQKCAESQDDEASDFKQVFEQAHAWKAYHIGDWQAQEDLNTNALVPKEEPKFNPEDNFEFDFPSTNDDAKDDLDQDDIADDDNNFDLKNYNS